MALTKMKKGTIIGHQTSRDEVISTLQRLGILEFTEIEEEDLLPDSIPAETKDTVENRLSNMSRSIDFLSRFDETKRSLIQQFAGSKVLLEEDIFLQHLNQEEEAWKICEECHALEKNIAEIENKISQLEDDEKDLLPFRTMDLPLEELEGTPTIGIFAGLLERKEFMSYREDVKRDLEDSILLELGEEEDREVPFLVFYYRPDEERLADLHGEYQLNRVDFPRERGTIQENVKEIQGERVTLQEVKDSEIKRSKILLKKKELLLAHHDAALLEREQHNILDRTRSTEQLFVMEGWIREDDEERLEKNLKGISQEIIYESRPPEEDEDPPVALNNPKGFRPFEVVTQLYGTPNNRDIDPTMIMAPFFFVFFGLCLTDAGYGILLSLLSFMALKKIRMAGMAEKLFQLLFLGGIATFFLGVLTGGWFGDLLPLREIWFLPEDDPQYFLIVSLVLGVIHVYVGLFVTLYKNVKNNNTQEALLNQGVWILFISGLLMKFVGPLVVESSLLSVLGSIGTFLGGGLLILTQGRHQKNIIARLGSGILSLYDLVGYLSDVLSYSRLLALGLATSVIATVINSIAQMANTIPVIGFLIMAVIMIIGHLFNLIINLISSYVHTSRLQYVEFFSKFLVGGGKPFSPFCVSTEYIDLNFTKEGPLMTQKRDRELSL